MVYRTTTLPPLFTLGRELDRLFDDAVRSPSASRTAWTPAADVREEADAFRIEIELPGVSPEQVEVTTEKQVLTVQGEKPAPEVQGEPSSWRVIERRRGAFRRTFQLPETAAEDRISASFAHGVLTVLVPKAEVPKPRKIEITR